MVGGEELRDVAVVSVLDVYRRALQLGDAAAHRLEERLVRGRVRVRVSASVRVRVRVRARVRVRWRGVPRAAAAEAAHPARRAA